MKEKIAANIRAERARSGLSQEETAKAIGVSRENYSRFETSDIDIKAFYLCRLSVVFNCSVNDFFVGIDYTNCGIYTDEEDKED